MYVVSYSQFLIVLYHNAFYPINVKGHKAKIVWDKAEPNYLTHPTIPGNNE